MTIIEFEPSSNFQEFHNKMNLKGNMIPTLFSNNFLYHFLIKDSNTL